MRCKYRTSPPASAEEESKIMHPYMDSLSSTTTHQSRFTCRLTSDPASPILLRPFCVDTQSCALVTKTSWEVSGFGSESFMVADRSTGSLLRQKGAELGGSGSRLTVGQNHLDSRLWEWWCYQRLC